ncbi:MAG: hypothetical protein D6696_15595 [Acidobacteria bacterium]|nr:MAG: hypothetical protein D6696_15595 [Acidobacteriota bacterium]
MRDELKAACRAHELPADGRARPLLAGRLLRAAGLEDVELRSTFRAGGDATRQVPAVGDVVAVRRRQYLVTEVVTPPGPRQATRVELACLDDDAQGERLSVLWELELGARMVRPERHGLSEPLRLDEPRTFAAYLHTLAWHAVTATDAARFQSPFRAGIKILSHQLTPLAKALELPRANLFIADDVGLGKTIEAGLVLQELVLRQRVSYTIVVCPAAIALQWQSEMARRFGLRFEIMSRAFVARMRQARGFRVNPWTTYHRFIVSYPLLRRPEYREPLLSHLGQRRKKSLLILDEAHTAAPASASRYAVDSQITQVVRDLAPKLENRLFLSATPHNGHSNSFSALLELLDPQRFTRGVKVTSAAQLRPVMVRRLKSDLRALGIGRYPERRVLQIALEHRDGVWWARYREIGSRDAAPAIRVGTFRPVGEPVGEPVDLHLARLLKEYTELMRPASGRGRLVFVNLQKRLLSSLEAFWRTLKVHAKSAGRRLAAAAAAGEDVDGTDGEDAADEEPYGSDEEEAEALLAARVVAESAAVAAPAGRARALLEEMLDLAGRHRHAPDAKALAILAWLRQHCCPGLAPGGVPREAPAEARRWSDRRVILFTEYADTKRWLMQLLAAAADGTDDGADRILSFHGGMSDEQRDEVQRAFNGPPETHPVRILVATDAAREGVNLQGHCADLFHLDVPWNPARMEQRNGRIDRTLQPAPEVRCHYFVLPQRAEDRVLGVLVDKVERIQRELGSLAAVVLERMAKVMDDGIDPSTGERLAAVEASDRQREVSGAELESTRADRAALRREIERAETILDRSRSAIPLDAERLRAALDVALELAGAGPLRPIESAAPAAGDDPPAFLLPPLPAGWQETLDSLRPPRRRDQPLWEWRQQEPLPVIFKPPARMTEERVHLHLEHPLVQRLLARFRAQGFGAHDLERVTVLANPHHASVRVVAFGRLSLFGDGASRLHDQLVAIAARWHEGRGDGHLEPLRARSQQQTLDALYRLLASPPPLDAVGRTARERLLAAAAGDFARLWPSLEEEADSLAHEAEGKLTRRGHAEADGLRRLLEAQRAAIERTLGERRQMVIEWTAAEREQRRQYEQDQRHLARRLAAIGREIDEEPRQIEYLYRVALRRFEPVGLVYLWPESRG